MLDATTSRGRGTSERILASGVDLFSRFGYNGVSTRDIALAANVNEVTIYRHYPRKRDLYVAVLESELREVRLNGEMLANIAEAANAGLALGRTFEIVVQTLMHRPKMLRLLNYGVLELNGDLDPLVRRHLGELIDVIARYLEPWVQKGELRCTDAKTVIFTLISIVIGHSSLKRLFLGETLSQHSMYAAYADIALREHPVSGQSVQSPSSASILPHETGEG